MGVTVLARLDTADAVITTIVSTPGATDESISAAALRLPWVRDVDRVVIGRSRAAAERALPRPDPRQALALRHGRSIVLCGRGEDGKPQVFLVHALPSGSWLYVGVSPDWLWTNAGDFTTNASFLLLDGQGTVLNAAGRLPAALPAAEPALFRRISARRIGSNDARFEALPDGTLYRSWEVFLAGRFDSPSWQLVVLAPRPSLMAGGGESYLTLVAVALLTLLLIVWLSITTIRRQLLPLQLLTRATARLAQRKFDAFDGMNWRDEFGDLARAFRDMAGKLGVQFAALEMLSSVDRLLLDAPQLERILDQILPQMASLLQCDLASVILFDPDSDDHARAYDFVVAEAGQRPIRRISTDVACLKAIRAPTMAPSASRAAQVAFPDRIFGDHCAAGTIRLHPLKYADQYAGLLCVAYFARTGESPLVIEPGIRTADLADRLSVILENVRHSETLYQQANFDALTGLQNRHLIAERVRDMIAAAAAAGGSGALLYIDLDHFKPVNDTAGHLAGDELLRVVGQRLLRDAGEGLQVARLAGDEFAVLMPTLNAPEEARSLAERLIASLELAVPVQGREHFVSASIGIALFPNDGATLEELLKVGDIAMYHAKAAGRGRAEFFKIEMRSALEERLKIESDLHRALLRNEFTLHYQPIVADTVPRKIGVEALVRWPGASSRWNSPGVFVPIAEENGIIVELGKWILRTACAQFAAWRSAGVAPDYVSVNVSVRQLRERDFLDALVLALDQSGIRGEDLQIEITESVLAEGLELRQTLRAISERGVRIALDDFGTGYSSLSYLRNYPIDTVKIDRSFVRGLPQEAAACRLAQSIVAMCAALGKNVLAEGVETEMQRQCLRELGCRTYQGYLFGRPMEPDDVPGFLNRLRDGDRNEIGERSAQVGTITARPESTAA
ncbi:MAG: EAL domain-containing protein [Gammaproteobacteria bacterium]|nr:EAL domain-containing protein [Gammaproteobacteria bacterium]